jgi:hypothetical protein
MRVADNDEPAAARVLSHDCGIFHRCARQRALPARGVLCSSLARGRADALREAEVLGCAPDACTAKMAERLAEGARALVKGFERRARRSASVAHRD